MEVATMEILKDTIDNLIDIFSKYCGSCAATRRDILRMKLKLKLKFFDTYLDTMREGSIIPKFSHLKLT